MRATLPPRTGPPGGATDARPAAEDPLAVHALRDPLSPEGPPVQRAVVTNGGTFDAKKYEAVPDGASIVLEFMPNAVAKRNARKIGMIQTIHRVVGGEVPIDSRNRGKVAENGHHVDQDGNRNPVYQSADDGEAKSLADVPLDKKFDHGRPWEASKPDVPAEHRDTPKGDQEMITAGVEMTDSFETAALVLEPLPIWLGSVKWGWATEAGKTVLSPTEIELGAVGAPGDTFMKAGGAWNTSFEDPDVLPVPTVSEAHPRAAPIQGMTAQAARERIPVVTARIHEVAIRAERLLTVVPLLERLRTQALGFAAEAEDGGDESGDEKRQAPTRAPLTEDTKAVPKVLASASTAKEAEGDDTEGDFHDDDELDAKSESGDLPDMDDEAFAAKKAYHDRVAYALNVARQPANELWQLVFELQLLVEKRDRG